MTKQEIQQRVLLNGKPLSMDKFSWDEATNIFSSNENKLVIDLCDIHRCTVKTGDNSTVKTGGSSTVKTGWYSTVKTGDDSTVKTGDNSTVKTGDNSTVTTGDNSTVTTGDDSTVTTGDDSTVKTGWYSTVKTSWYSTVKTGDNSTVKTGWYSTVKTGDNSTVKTGDNSTVTTGGSSTVTTGGQSAIIRSDIFCIIQPLEGEIIKTCPQNVEGYISRITGEDTFYMQINGERIEHVIADNILSRVIRKKGRVHHVINNGEKNISFLITDGVNWSHGKTLKEAKDSLMYKISDRDTSAYNDMTPETVLSLEEGIKSYRAIAGACESQTKAFVESLPKRKKKYSIKEIAEITNGQYNSQVFRNFFKI